MSHHNPELKPYAEPVAASALWSQETYFMVTYLDLDMLVPEIKTLVFLGRDIEGLGNGDLYFQDLESYTTLGAYPNAKGKGDLYSCTEDQLNNIFELDKAIDELSRCSIRRAMNSPGKYEFLGA